MGYNATATVAGLKLHCCVNCGTVFHYILTRKIGGQGGTEKSAQESLAANVGKIMQSGVDRHPCPTCGMVQPEMVGMKRKPSHTFQAICAAAVAATLAILLGLDVLKFATASFIAAGSYLLISLWVFITAWRNPNNRLDEQLQIAQGELQREVLGIQTEGDASNPKLMDPASATEGGHLLAAGLLAIAVVMALIPEAVRIANGWPANEKWYPAVVGPGDTSTYYFARKINSIKGYWQGRCEASIANGKELGIAKPLICRATTKDNTWGNTIHADSGEKSDGGTIYASVTMPQEQTLASKSVDVDLAIVYRFPQARGEASFEVVDGNLQESTTLQLAAPGVGKTYATLGWIGSTAGGVWIMLLGFWMAFRAGRLSGNPYETHLLGNQ